MSSLDDHMGPRWEDAFRQHLRRLAAEGDLGEWIVAVGRFWRGGGDEIDAVALAGRFRSAVLVGEAKWARSVDAAAVEALLARKAAALPQLRDPLRLAVAARAHVRNPSPATLAIDAADIFAISGN